MENELTNTTQQSVTALDNLAAEARMYSLNVRMNLFHLARVFSEARKLLPHGEWGKWVEENAGVEMRTAQQMIASFERFGGMPQLATLDRTKLYKMTALPPGTEEAFMQEHDVPAMSTREVEKAVKAFKDKMQAEIDLERKAREEAERRAEEAEKRAPEIPEEITQTITTMRQDIQTKDAEIARLAEIGRDSLEERHKLARENAELKREAEETKEMLLDQQAEIDRVQGELLDLQSTQARYDTEHPVTDELTPETFASAVRQFVGTCARMPYMTRTFSTMAQRNRDQYDDLLKAVEGWCRGARQALESYAASEVINVE